MSWPPSSGQACAFSSFLFDSRLVPILGRICFQIMGMELRLGQENARGILYEAADVAPPVIFISISVDHFSQRIFVSYSIIFGYSSGILVLSFSVVSL